MAWTVNYPWESIGTTAAKDYLEEMDTDVFNGDTTLQDLKVLSHHLARYIALLRESMREVVR